MIVIFTYERPQMLQRVIDEASETYHDILILDDGSSYDVSNLDLKGADYRRYEHGGKEGYWKQWDRAMRFCKESYDNHFIFLPDDWHSFDFDTVEWVQKQFGDEPYAFNLANKGCSKSWTPYIAHFWKIGVMDCYKMGFVDCCFSTNRSALRRLNFEIDPTNQRKGRSSGVGKQLSQRFLRLGVPMYKPIKSLCDEDPHESFMNPEERLRHPNLPQ